MTPIREPAPQPAMAYEPAPQQTYRQSETEHREQPGEHHQPQQQPQQQQQPPQQPPQQQQQQVAANGGQSAEEMAAGGLGFESPFEDELDTPAFLRKRSGGSDEDRDIPAFMRRGGSE